MVKSGEFIEYKIKRIIHGSALANRLIAEVEGDKYHIRHYSYLHDNGIEYTHITGGVVWPMFGEDGYAIVVGVVGDGKEIHCIEEFKTEDVSELYQYCLETQINYGRDIYNDVFRTWYGDPTRMLTLITERGLNKNLIVSQPPDFDREDHFQLYIQRIKDLASKKNKVLVLNDCNMLRGSIMAASKNKRLKAKDNPVLVTAGWTLHAIIAYKPWRQALQKEQLIPTGSAEYLRWKQKENKLNLKRLLHGKRKRNIR